MWRYGIGKARAFSAGRRRRGCGTVALAAMLACGLIGFMARNARAEERGPERLPAEAEQAIATFVVKALPITGEAPPMDWPAALADRRFGVYVALRSQGRLLGDGWSEEQPLPEALFAALVRAKFKAGEQEPGKIDTVEIDLAHHFRRVEPDDAGARLSDENRGVLGLRMVLDGKLMVLAPSEMVARNVGYGGLVRPAGRRAPDASGEYEVFDAYQLLVQPMSPPKVISLFRGNQVVPMSDVTLDGARVLTLLLIDWLDRQVQADGRMVFTYWPSDGRAVSEGDAVDLFMAAWVMSRVSASLPRRSGVFEQAEEFLATNLRRYYRADDERGMILNDGKNQLGAIALAALAIRESPARKSFEEVDARLCATIEHLWQEDGTLRSIPHEADQGAVDVGAALVLLADMQAQSGDGQRLEKLKRSLTHYRQSAGAEPERVYWLTSACAKIRALSKDAELARAIFEMNDGLVELQEWEKSPYPDLRGRFVDAAASGRAEPAQGPILGSLIDAFRVAEESGDDTRAERYRAAIARGVRHLMQLQFLDEVDQFYVTEKARVEGGLRTAVYRSEIRADRNVSALLAMMEIFDAFSEGDFRVGSLP